MFLTDAMKYEKPPHRRTGDFEQQRKEIIKGYSQEKYLKTIADDAVSSDEKTEEQRKAGKRDENR